MVNRNYKNDQKICFSNQGIYLISAVIAPVKCYFSRYSRYVETHCHMTLYASAYSREERYLHDISMSDTFMQTDFDKEYSVGRAELNQVIKVDDHLCMKFH